MDRWVIRSFQVCLSDLFFFLNHLSDKLMIVIEDFFPLIEVVILNLVDLFDTFGLVEVGVVELLGQKRFYWGHLHSLHLAENNALVVGFLVPMPHWVEVLNDWFYFGHLAAVDGAFLSFLDLGFVLEHFVTSHWVYYAGVSRILIVFEQFLKWLFQLLQVIVHKYFL